MTTSSGLARLNALPPDQAERELLACCGSTRWAQAMAVRRPYENEDELLRAADHVWWALDRNDWLEAFLHHPRIGGRKAQAAVGERASNWSDGEQAGMKDASANTADEMARLNDEYAEKFGHIYIVSASGRTADELLHLLRARLNNDPRSELRLAADEQSKITRLRLEKLLRSA